LSGSAAMAPPDTAATSTKPATHFRIFTSASRGPNLWIDGEDPSREYRMHRHTSDDTPIQV
jgi:hypothetical protein